MGRDGYTNMIYVQTAEMHADYFTLQLSMTPFWKQFATMDIIGVRIGHGLAIGIWNGHPNSLCMLGNYKGMVLQLE